MRALTGKIADSLPLYTDNTFKLTFWGVLYQKLVTYKRLVLQTCSPNPLTDCCLVSFQLRKPKMPFELRRVMANVTSLDSFVRAMSIETTFMTSLKEVVRRLNSGEKSMHKTSPPLLSVENTTVHILDLEHLPE